MEVTRPDELTGEILMEYTLVGGTFTIKAVNTWGLGLSSTNREGTKRYFHFDALGSTRALTDSSETVTDTYEYNAFGVVESSSGTSVNPYRYVGQYGYYDDGAMGSSSGLLLLGVRYYSPAHGRFWSWDPVRNLNLYVYVNNSATMAIDPSGNQAVATMTAAEALLVAGTAAAADGPLPIGDVVGLILLAAVAVAVVAAPRRTNPRQDDTGSRPRDWPPPPNTPVNLRECYSHLYECSFYRKPPGWAPWTDPCGECFRRCVQNGGHWPSEDERCRYWERERFGYSSILPSPFGSPRPARLT
ncbi:MAG: RHS repeat-associated core domain-containing protein [Armatimonadota bacterium]